MFRRIPSYRTRLAFIVVAGLAVLATSCATRTGRTPGAPDQRAEELRVHLRESVDLLQGHWVLQQRINPDGSRHAQPLQGEMTINLQVDSAALSRGTPRAVGDYIGKEAGVMDSGFSGFGPDDVINPVPLNGNVMFEMNVKSGLQIDVEMNSPATVTLTYNNLELRGTYGVFRQGLRSASVPTKYRKTDRNADGGPSLTLMETVAASSVDTPANARETLGSPSDKSHDIVKHVITRNRMDIAYGNGGRDVWVRR